MSAPFCKLDSLLPSLKHSVETRDRLISRDDAKAAATLIIPAMPGLDAWMLASVKSDMKTSRMGWQSQNLPRFMSLYAGHFPHCQRDLSRIFFPHAFVDTAAMSELLRTRLDERMKSLGRSARALSLSVSKSPDLVRDILRGKTTTPRHETLRALAGELGVSVDWLLGHSDDPSPSAARAEPQGASAPLRTSMSNDVPVRGTAAGSFVKGAFQLSIDPVDYVRRPPALVGARDIYAVFIEGESMVPEHRPSDLRFVNPHRPARIGDSVIIQSRTHENAEIEATIGHLSKVTTDHIHIGKLNPVSEVKVPREFVIAIHKVLTMNDLFGV